MASECPVLLQVLANQPESSTVISCPNNVQQNVTEPISYVEYTHLERQDSGNCHLRIYSVLLSTLLFDRVNWLRSHGRDDHSSKKGVDPVQVESATGSMPPATVSQVGTVCASEPLPEEFGGAEF